MRLALILLLAALPVVAEFRRVEIDFEPTDCASCNESLQARLERVRGVEKAEVDLERSRVTLQLEAGNRARLAPLLSRITQDGTKIKRVEVSGRGTIERAANGSFSFQPSGLTQAYRLKLGESAAAIEPAAGVIYEMRATASAIEAGTEPDLTADSIEASSTSP